MLIQDDPILSIALLLIVALFLIFIFTVLYGKYKKTKEQKRRLTKCAGCSHFNQDTHFCEELKFSVSDIPVDVCEGPGATEK